MDCPLDPGYPEQKTLIKGNSADDLIMPYDQEGSMGGIYRSVTLRGRGDVGIRDLWTVTDLSPDLKHAGLGSKTLVARTRRRRAMRGYRES